MLLSSRNELDLHARHCGSISAIQHAAFGDLSARSGFASACQHFSLSVFSLEAYRS